MNQLTEWLALPWAQKLTDAVRTVLPEYGLRLYQKPAGGDLRDAIAPAGSRDPDARAARS